MRVENHGSLVLLRPDTDAEREWLDEHVACESWAWWGDALACEPRYVDAILAGLERDVGWLDVVSADDGPIERYDY